MDMSPFSFLALVIVAGVCGAIGRSLAGAGKMGLFATVAAGFIGAMLGQWMADGLGLPEPFYLTIDDWSFPVVWTIAGSALFVALLGFLRRGK